MMANGIPRGWRIVRLSELADIASGVTKGRRLTDPTVRVPYLRVANVQDGYLAMDEIKEIDVLPVDVQKLRLQRGDILLTEGGDFDKLGRGTMWNGELECCIHQNHIFRVRVDREIVHPEYFSDFLGSRPAKAYFLRCAKQTTGIASINRTQLSRLPVLLPPLSEQRRIAAILDKADALRRKRQQALQLTDQFLRSTFLDMFGDPVRNPKGWPIVETGEVLEGMQYGTSTKCSDARSEDALPVLRIPNVASGVVSRADLKYANLPPSEADGLLLRNDDILFVRTNGNPDFIGRCAVYESGEPTLFASYLIRARLRPSAQCRIRYFRDVISFPTYRNAIVKEARTTAGNYNISTRGLRRLRMALPPIELQDRYLGIASCAEGTSAVLRNQMAMAETFFHALVQRAFRGEL